jgi:threonine dehydratase
VRVDDVRAAAERIAGHIVTTPCRPSAALSEAVGAEVYLKLENRQLSGSFKLRGVMNRLLSLSPEQAESELVAASTGNHGAAFAHAVKVLGFRGRLFLPTHAAAAKLEAIEASGVPFELVGNDCVETENHARDYARANGCTWVSPYNDPWVVAGQGTVALELFKQLDALDFVMIPVGGGGLAGGVGAALKGAPRGATLLGCQPANSPVMLESVNAGRIVEYDSLPTLSDATAGGIEPGSITFELCRRHVDEYPVVSEDEIAAAIRFMHRHEDMVVEGGAALPVAALLQDPQRFAGTTVALVVTGSKIDEGVLEEVLA